MNKIETIRMNSHWQKIAALEEEVKNIKNRVKGIYYATVFLVFLTIILTVSGFFL